MGCQGTFSISLSVVVGDGVIRLFQHYKVSQDEALTSLSKGSQFGSFSGPVPSVVMAVSCEFKQLSN
uniref:HDC03004 n=1 Tax=Drosophila melanogaster TaxID=7227 RepID=Q6IH88_DROME|nr:TPA_inf: HDC03004 [Drosophila melanogaster]